MKSPAMRLSIIVALASLFIVGRLALVWLPNVSLSFLALAVAGFAYGPRVGAAVGFLGRLGSDLLISGLNPVFLPMLLVESFVGAVLGIAGNTMGLSTRFARPGWWTRIILFDVGVLLTLVYSIVSDSTTWVYYNWMLPDAPDAAQGALWTTLVVLGLAFNVVPALLHGLLFAAALPPILRGLRESSLLPERHPTTLDAVESTALPRGP